VYFAYNPSTVREYLQPPIVADRSSFPNNATFLNAIASYGQAYPFFERRTLFRFTVGRTFCWKPWRGTLACRIDTRVDAQFGDGGWPRAPG